MHAQVRCAVRRRSEGAEAEGWRCGAVDHGGGQVHAQVRCVVRGRSEGAEAEERSTTRERGARARAAAAPAEAAGSVVSATERRR